MSQYAVKFDWFTWLLWQQILYSLKDPQWDTCKNLKKTVECFFFLRSTKEALTLKTVEEGAKQN